ncbi:unnamed protein product [Rhizophagus irregularis]|nr:unnamed protein product [Rhizophagus irregularis]
MFKPLSRTGTTHFECRQPLNLSDILDTRPVRALASKWDSNRSRNQFHIHQPTFTNDGTNNVKQSDEISVPSSPSKEQEIYHHDYIEDPDWDSFEIDVIDIIKIFNSLRNSNLPRKNPESAILGILGLTRQHKLTKNKLITIWSDLLNDFQLDVVSLDPYQDKFRKYWSEQQLTASRERRKEANKERARIGQKTDIIIELLTGPALICEVSGGLPKKMTDKVDVIVFGCQVIGLQLNLYAMDTRTTGIYRFGTID